MKLLVAIDFSDNMDTVVAQARTIAEALAAKVWLVHVADPEPAFVGYDVGPQYERDAVAEKFRQEHSALQAHSQHMASRRHRHNGFAGAGNNGGNPAKRSMLICKLT